MKLAIAAAAVLIFAQAGSQQMIAPNVARTTTQTTETHTIITRTCPDGYEAHLVDTNLGFDTPQISATFGNSWGVYGTQAYTICFSPKFMDDIRKNPDMQIIRPGSSIMPLAATSNGHVFSY